MEHPPDSQPHFRTVMNQRRHDHGELRQRVGAYSEGEQVQLQIRKLLVVHHAAEELVHRKGYMRSMLVRVRSRQVERGE
jgi:hypothetical protein